jgi:hypothetical protein
MTNRDHELERKRQRQRNRFNRDPEAFRNRQKSYRADNPEYVDKIKIRVRERRLGNPEWYLWDKARSRAKKGQLPFNIEVKDVIIPEVCPILEMPLKVLGLRNGHQCPTIDRVDNSKGYVKGNIVVISYRANSIKRDATLDELEKLVEFYHKLRKERGE